MPHWDDIRGLYNTPSLSDTLASIKTYRQQSNLTPWMEKCLDTLLAGCPNSAGIWWIMAQETRLMSIQEVLRIEMALSYQMVLNMPDFGEGVRAVLIDKDRNPKWSNTFDTLDMKNLQAIWTECTMTDLQFDETMHSG